MTPTPTYDSPVTLRSLLFDEDVAQEAPVGSMARAVQRDGAVQAALKARRHLSSDSLGIVAREVGALADGLLDLNLSDVLVGACCTYGTLIEAGRRTLVRPGTEEVVCLAAHQVTSHYSPRIDVFVENARIHTFELELEISIHLTGVEAVVRDGGMISLRSGRCQAAASLSLDLAPLAKGQRTVEAWEIVRLRPPVPLVRPRP
jgi:hypothetical protein